MQNMKEVLQLLEKATNMKLNIAILVVSISIIYFSRFENFAVDAVTLKVLNGLCFVTLVRVIYGLIGALYDLLKRKVEKRKEIEEKERIKQERQFQRLKDIEDIRNSLHTLDIFQLHIIDSLKKQNHFSVKKGAPLFTLKTLGIIYTPAVGKSTESAALTKKALEVLNGGEWGNFDEIKRKAISKFLSELQNEEYGHFAGFLEKERINTKKSSRSYSTSSYYSNEYIFRKYSDTILFSQPQRNNIYVITPLAKEILKFVSEKIEPAGING